MAHARSSRLMAGGLLMAALALAGCSSMNNGSDATAAIAGTGAAPAAVGAGQPAAPIVPALPPVAEASCEAVKSELTALGEEKIPQKLAQFGQSKYTPSADETAKFTRYVELNQASKARCAKVADPAAPATKKKKTASVAGATQTATATAATKSKTKSETVAAATQTTTKKKAAAAATTASAASEPAADASSEDLTPVIGTKPKAVTVDPATEGVTTTVVPD